MKKISVLILLVGVMCCTGCAASRLNSDSYVWNKDTSQSDGPAAFASKSQQDMTNCKKVHMYFHRQKSEAYMEDVRRCMEGKGYKYIGESSSSRQNKTYVDDNCFVSQWDPRLVIKVDPRMSFVGDKTINGVDMRVFRSNYRKLQIMDTSRSQDKVGGLNLGLSPFSIHAGGAVQVNCGIDSYTAKNIMGVTCLVSEDSRQEYGIEYFEVVDPSVFSGDVNSLLDQTKSHFRNSVEFIAYNSPSNKSTAGHREHKIRDIPKWSSMVRADLDNKKYDEAIRHAELFINTHPDCVSAYVLKSRGLYLKGDFNQALLFIDKAGDKVLNWESWEGRGAENSRTPQEALKAYEAFKVIVMRIDQQKQIIQQALAKKEAGQLK